MRVNDQVLYIGAETDDAVHPDWFVAETLQDALGIYIFYMPEVIVFNGEHPIAQAAFDHIASVTEHSPRGLEFMLVLDAVWPAPPATVLHHAASEDDVQAALLALRHARDITAEVM